MRGDEQADQRARRVRRAAQRVDDGDQAEAAAGLAQIAEPGAQPDHRLRVEPGVEDQLVEFVVLGDAAQHVRNRPFDLAGAREDRIDVGPAADLDAEIVDVAVPPPSAVGISSRTRKPKFSSTGTASDSGIRPPRR